MKPKIKNEKIKQAIAFEKNNNIQNKSFPAAADVYSESTIEQVALSILWGYVSSLIEVSEFPEVNLGLDLTYSTVKNLITVVAYEFMFGMNPKSGYTTQQNVEIAAKSIAAYLIFLALNEHNTKLSIPVPKSMNNDRIYSKDTWSGLEVKLVGTLVFTDLLKYCVDGIKYENGHLIINVDKVASGYKTVTGKDLKALGFDSADISIK